jgi:sulfur carrier protein ThiS
MEQESNASSETTFVEFRRKVRTSQLLATAVSQLLREIHFTGRISVVVQNGTILKSGYEEGYFTRKDDRRLT